MTLTRPDITNKVPHLRLRFARAAIASGSIVEACVEDGEFASIGFCHAEIGGFDDLPLRGPSHLASARAFERRRFAKHCLGNGYHLVVGRWHALEGGPAGATACSRKQPTGAAQPKNFSKKFDPIATNTL